MFAYIRGKLANATPTVVVVEAHGVGYEVMIPPNLFDKLPTMEEDVCLHVSLVIRENAHTLYGFLSGSTKAIFETLLNVSGIGPKTALALIGHLTGSELQDAICNARATKIAKVPGIGKRTAERLILELRDKLPTIFPRDPEESNIRETADPKAILIRDAMSALINLGYSQASARNAIEKVLDHTNPENLDLQSLITQALKTR